MQRWFLHRRIPAVQWHSRLPGWVRRNLGCVLGYLVSDSPFITITSAKETNWELLPPHFSCPPFAFRCLYGACIAGRLECNGKQNCVDNSDELTLSCPGIKEIYSRTGNCTYDPRSFNLLHCDLPDWKSWSCRFKNFQLEN